MKTTKKRRSAKKQEQPVKAPVKTPEERLDYRRPCEISEEIAEIFARIETAVCLAYQITNAEISSGESAHYVSRARALAADLLRGKCSIQQRAYVWRVAPSTVVYAQRLPTLDARLFDANKTLAMYHLAQITAALDASEPTQQQQEIALRVKKRAEEIAQTVGKARRSLEAN